MNFVVSTVYLVCSMLMFFIVFCSNNSDWRKLHAWLG